MQYFSKKFLKKTADIFLNIESKKILLLAETIKKVEMKYLKTVMVKLGYFKSNKASYKTNFLYECECIFCVKLQYQNLG